MAGLASSKRLVLEHPFTAAKHRHARIVVEWLCGHTLQEIGAREGGVTRQRVQQIIRRRLQRVGLPKAERGNLEHIQEVIDRSIILEKHDERRNG